jgi:putative addiction module killer protein
MIQVRRTSVYDKWIKELRDVEARSRINIRVRRLAIGNPGDVRPVGEGISELRINYGPGYRVYYLQRGDVFILLLCGGDKAGQRRDIERAKQLAQEWES